MDKKDLKSGILGFIPGFRTGTKWKMIVASIYYLVTLLYLFIDIGFFLPILSLPFFIMSLATAIKSKNKIYFIISGIALVLLIIGFAVMPKSDDIQGTIPTETAVPTAETPTSAPDATLTSAPILTQEPTPIATIMPTEVPVISTESLETHTAGEENLNSATTEDFLNDVKIAIDGQIGKNESITGVTLENNDLCVYVDFSHVDPAPLTFELLAESRTSSITDAILDLDSYDSLWETITVDFGEVGHITNGKGNIGSNSVGRYFRVENFKLEK